MFSILSLTENASTFKRYEQKILEITRNIGSCSMKNQLEELDDRILKMLDKSIFRNKGKKRLDYKTKLAEVEVFRRVYMIDIVALENIQDKEKNIFYLLAKNRIEQGKKSIYMLDELLKLKEYGKISSGVVDLIVESIKNNSFRETARNVNQITGLNLSAVAVWNVVQIIGRNLAVKEKFEQEKQESDELSHGVKENHVLFCELDGVNIRLQGKDRKEAIEKYKTSNPEIETVPKSVSKKEIKVVSVYEGWTKESKKRVRLVNKKVFAQVIDVVNIKDLSRTYISKTYNRDTLKMLVKNSDAGTWTKEKDSSKEVYQIDMYHIKEKITSCVRDSNDRIKMKELLDNKKYKEMIQFAEELKYTYDGEASEISRLNILQRYIQKNSKYFRRYQETELFNKVKQKGTWYKNLGTQESTNYSVLTRRMKRRRMCFSIVGADNLSRVLALASSYDFKGINETFNTQLIPKKLIDESEEYIRKIEEDIEKNKKCKLRKIKYNESFVTKIPGLEIKTDENMQKVKGLILA